MKPEQRIEIIRQRLQTLEPSALEITDDSAQHHGHAGAQGGGHYSVRLASAHFNDKNTLACHRLVYAALGDLMDHEIHALSIQIDRPSN